MAQVGKGEFDRLRELLGMSETVPSGPVSYTHLDVYKRQGLCYVTTLSAATAFVQAIQMVKTSDLGVYALQDLATMGEE